MPEIRLSKVLKELNISIDRAVDFLEAKGQTVEKNPNSKIDVPTYDILVNEFRSDAKQKQASGEVVINKISDIKAAEKKEADAKAAAEKPVVIEKPTPTEKTVVAEKPEITQTTKVELEGPKTVGKIDLDALKPKAKQEKAVAKEEVKKEEIKKEETPAPKAEEKPKEAPVETKGPKVIKVIDLDKINNTGKPKKQD